jgi:hypothetical protein
MLVQGMKNVRESDQLDMVIDQRDCSVTLVLYIGIALIIVVL